MEQTDIKSFLDIYQKNYNYLYDYHIYSNELVDAGDEFLLKHSDYVLAYELEKQDIFASDREVSAFALTMYDLGLEKPAKNSMWKERYKNDKRETA